LCSALFPREHTCFTVLDHEASRRALGSKIDGLVVRYRVAQVVGSGGTCPCRPPRAPSWPSSFPLPGLLAMVTVRLTPPVEIWLSSCAQMHSYEGIISWELGAGSCAMCIYLGCIWASIHGCKLQALAAVIGRIGWEKRRASILCTVFRTVWLQLGPNHSLPRPLDRWAPGA
jgi:hypothetical protein